MESEGGAGLDGVDPSELCSLFRNSAGSLAQAEM